MIHSKKGKKKKEKKNQLNKKLSIHNAKIFKNYTSLESIASFMIWIHPLNVATWKRHKYALPT
jgi:hypothetical protein